MRLRSGELAWLLWWLWLVWGEESERRVLLEGKLPVLTPLEKYQALLRAKRGEQLAATKRIMAMGEYEKRYRMVETLASAMGDVVGAARVELGAQGFSPGDAFPESETAGGADALARLLENAAFWADLSLRLPEVSVALFRDKREFRETMSWALVWANATGFYDSTTTKLMHLAGMELGLVEKEADFVNPYREQRRRQAQELAKNVSDEMKAKKAEKKAKAKKRGPRLSGGEL